MQTPPARADTTTKHTKETYSYPKENEAGIVVTGFKISRSRCRYLGMGDHSATARHSGEEGFTLIELMVVVMIIAVLLVFAIPSFLGFRERARDSAAQSTLNNAEKVATVVAIDHEGFPGTDALLLLLPTLEPRIEWLDHIDSSTGPRQVSIDHDDNGNELAMATMSESGICFYQRLHRLGPTVKHHIDNAATCNAHTFQDGVGIGW